MEQLGNPNGKTPKQQLSKGMEHIRHLVTVPDTAPVTPPTDSTAPVEGESAYGVPATFEPIRRPATESANNPEKRTDPFQFGSRFLEQGDDIFAYNAWDHVETDDTYKAFIASQAEFQRSAPVSEFDKKRFCDRPEKWWDKFYSNNQANFFKDRKWLVQEFPILSEVTREGHGQVKILEVGAGAGNTAFPILEMNRNDQLSIHACDYSKKAVEVIRANKAYGSDVLRADVWDAAGEGEAALPPGVETGTVDIVIMIFIFSALAPSQWDQAVWNVWNLLKPGGVILFRDYGRGDLAQVRFKKGRYLEENFYVRGDGTRVYFFEKDELEHIWTGREIGVKQGGDDADAKLAERIDRTTLEEVDAPSQRPAFEVVNLGVDRRMLVNRQRKLKMYRCWMQGLFRKPETSAVVG